MYTSLEEFLALSQFYNSTSFESIQSITAFAIMMMLINSFWNQQVDLQPNPRGHGRRRRHRVFTPIYVYSMQNHHQIAQMCSQHYTNFMTGKLSSSLASDQRTQKDVFASIIIVAVAPNMHISCMSRVQLSC